MKTTIPKNLLIDGIFVSATKVALLGKSCGNKVELPLIKDNEFLRSGAFIDCLQSFFGFRFLPVLPFGQCHQSRPSVVSVRYLPMFSFAI